jgi:hypothetical protein
MDKFVQAVSITPAAHLSKDEVDPMKIENSIFYRGLYQARNGVSREGSLG